MLIVQALPGLGKTFLTNLYPKFVGDSDVYIQRMGLNPSPNVVSEILRNPDKFIKIVNNDAKLVLVTNFDMSALLHLFDGPVHYIKIAMIPQDYVDHLKMGKRTDLLNRFSEETLMSWADDYHDNAAIILRKGQYLTDALRKLDLIVPNPRLRLTRKGIYYSLPGLTTGIGNRLETHLPLRVHYTDPYFEKVESMHDLLSDTMLTEPSEEDFLFRSNIFDLIESKSRSMDHTNIVITCDWWSGGDFIVPSSLKAYLSLLKESWPKADMSKAARWYNFATSVIHRNWLKTSGCELHLISEKDCSTQDAYANAFANIVLTNVK